MKTFAVISHIYNEEALIEQFIGHYRRQGASEIIIIDNGSRDRTHEIIQSHWKDNFITLSVVEEDSLNDQSKHFRIMQAKKDCIGKHKYVLLVDCDEFIIPRPDVWNDCTLKDALERLDYSVIRTCGYNMVEHSGDEPFNDYLPIIEQRKHGYFSHDYSKPCIMIPEYYADHPYGNLHLGLHRLMSNTPLEIEWSDAKYSSFLLLHYQHFDKNISIQRRRKLTDRLSEENIRNGWVIENAGMTLADWEDWYEETKRNANIRKVIG